MLVKMRQAFAAHMAALPMGFLSFNQLAISNKLLVTRKE